MYRAIKIIALVIVLGSANAVAAQEKIKIGVIATLSGPPAAVGQQIRNGVELALEALGGKLGGKEVELIVHDDELKPDVAVSKVNALVERNEVDFIIGPVFSNILQAIIKPVTGSNTILISPNPGTSDFAGKLCNPNFFVMSIQNDQGSQAVGQYAMDQGIDRAIALVPNYQAGRDMVEGFKRAYKGELIDEIYVPLNQLDFSAEITRIAVEQPPAIFAFLPGGMGINFIKQFDQAGLSGKVQVLSVFTADEVALPAQKDAAIGVLAGTHWTPDLKNERNKIFVSAYEKAYKAVPASYAANAYDSIFLIDTALKVTQGDTSDVTALRNALKTAKFNSVRGSFKFNNNHYPIQDILISKVGKRPDGLYQTEFLETVFANNADHFAPECEMK